MAYNTHPTMIKRGVTKSGIPSTVVRYQNGEIVRFCCYEALRQRAEGDLRRSAALFLYLEELMIVIYETQRRSIGHCYAALLFVEWRGRPLILVLQHHPAGRNRWQSLFYETRDPTTETKPVWRSEVHEAATQALDALFEHLAPYGLPDDLLTLANSLLPQGEIGAPTYEPS